MTYERVEVNLIYPFFPAPPCPLQFRFIYHLILLLETFGIEAEHTDLWLGLGGYFEKRASDFPNVFFWLQAV